MRQPERASIIGQMGAVVLTLAILLGCGSDTKQGTGSDGLDGNGSPNMNGIFRLIQQSVEYNGCQGMADASSGGTGGIPGKEALLSLVPPMSRSPSRQTAPPRPPTNARGTRTHPAKQPG